METRGNPCKNSGREDRDIDPESREKGQLKPLSCHKNSDNHEDKSVGLAIRPYNKALGLRLHENLFISYQIGFISDGPTVYARPSSFHIGLTSCLYENAQIQYVPFNFRIFK